MIIDTHVHISLKSQKILHHRLMIEEYMSKIERIGGGKGIFFLNPFDIDYCCPNSLIDSKLHKSIVRNISDKVYSISCSCCKSTHYQGEDVFREKNITLLELAKEMNMYTLAFLSASEKAIQNQVDFYEENCPGFLGYKIHPTIMMCAADTFKIKSKKTIVFHSGNDEYASPKRILKFAENYAGNVVIAHLARFDRNSLIEISHMDNVWVDTSPYTFLYERIKSKPNQLCNTWGYDGEDCRAMELFLELADCVGYEKLLFASDEPFGDVIKEYQFVSENGLDSMVVKKITETNAERAFGIKDENI